MVQKHHSAEENEQPAPANPKKSKVEVGGMKLSYISNYNFGGT